MRLNRHYRLEKTRNSNTDQGCQFTSKAWIDQVEKNGIKVSIDGKGRNIIIERFWRTLKYEYILLHAINTIKEARKLIGQFIENYNYKRLHQNLNYQTPSEVYAVKYYLPLTAVSKRLHPDTTLRVL